MTEGAVREAYVGLGANLGDRAGAIRAAVERMGRLPGTRVVRVSSLHETAPVGGPAGQPAYLNAAARLETSLDAPSLLRALLDVERALGRVREREEARNAPRAIDLDLLLCGDAIVREGETCVVPHPRLAERAFVLAPLAEIAPRVVVPGTSPPATVATLLERADRSGLLSRTPFDPVPAT